MMRGASDGTCEGHRSGKNRTCPRHLPCGVAYPEGTHITCASLHLQGFCLSPVGNDSEQNLANSGATAPQATRIRPASPYGVRRSLKGLPKRNGPVRNLLLYWSTVPGRRVLLPDRLPPAHNRRGHSPEQLPAN